MKKVKSEMADELRPEYKRSDFGEIVRGKYANRIKEESNVILLEPDIARAFPNDEAVNKALRYLLEIAEASNRLTKRIWTPPVLQGDGSVIGVEDRLQSYIRPGWRTGLRAFMESAYREPIAATALLEPA